MWVSIFMASSITVESTKESSNKNSETGRHTLKVLEKKLTLELIQTEDTEETHTENQK